MVADFVLRHAGDAQRQRHIVQRRQVGQQAEVLEHHADAAAQQRPVMALELIDLLAEQIDAAAGRLLRQIHHAQQRRFAGAAGADDEMERTRRQREGNLLQDRGAVAVTKIYILK